VGRVGEPAPDRGGDEADCEDHGELCVQYRSEAESGFARGVWLIRSPVDLAEDAAVQRRFGARFPGAYSRGLASEQQQSDPDDAAPEQPVDRDQRGHGWTSYSSSITPDGNTAIPVLDDEQPVVPRLVRCGERHRRRRLAPTADGDALGVDIDARALRGDVRVHRDQPGVGDDVLQPAVGSSRAR